MNKYSILLKIKENKKELSIMFVIIFILLQLFPKISITFHIGILSLILLITSAVLGLDFGNLLIKRVEKKIKEQKARRGGKEYCPLEFCFFIFIFIATVFLTYAMSFRGYQTIQGFQSYTIYWTLTTFFYTSALSTGIAHYAKGIHGWIK